MQEEVKNKLLEQVGDIAEMTKEGLMKTVEVLQEQCPLLVEELLRWHYTISSLTWLMFTVLFLILMVVSFYMWQEICAEIKKNPGEPNEWLLLGLVLQILFCLPLIGVFKNLLWLKIWIAPRLFLLEYIGDLIG